ncbi:MAG: crosslink repair DNA glycosylase YcaQ family protein, partial [Acidobacteriota bacterium]|nr:crosslink repair DNA glycosylase YcaQ family protein [Acidobacteriota bacterium]
TTHMLEAMHYKGVLRVAGRDTGIRLYAPQETGTAVTGALARRARLDALVDIVVHKYAPLPAASLSYVIARLRYAVPHWRTELRAAQARARQRLSYAVVNGQSWYWPADEAIPSDEAPAEVRLLAPFDPVVWDRRRFELLWEWAYRFEAYTPESKRKLGYYALPLLWRDHVVGWANVSLKDRKLHVATGYVTGKAPRDRAFKRELEAELARMRQFLGA